MHHDFTIDRILKKFRIPQLKCISELSFVLHMGNVGFNVRVLYIRSLNNLRPLELLSHLTVHIGATFVAVKNFDLTLEFKLLIDNLC